MGWVLVVLRGLAAQVGMEALRRAMDALEGAVVPTSSTPEPASAPLNATSSCACKSHANDFEDDPLVEETRWDRAVTTRRPPRGCFWGY